MKTVAKRTEIHQKGCSSKRTHSLTSNQSEILHSLIFSFSVIPTDFSGITKNRISTISSFSSSELLEIHNAHTLRKAISGNDISADNSAVGEESSILL